MNRAHRFRSRLAMPFAGKWLAASLCVCLAGFAASALAAPQLATPPILAPAAATSSQVHVDQLPLTIGKPIPPNVVLMLDDSGSMRWDIMPDWDYLPAPNWHDIRNNWNHFVAADVEPLLDSKINGVYYNPKLTYTPPPKADGTSYPNADFDDALVNGFDTSATPITVDLSTYRGKYDFNTTAYVASSVPYSISVETGAASYAPASSCPSGWETSGKYPGYCSHKSKPNRHVNFYDNNNGYFYVSRCNSVNDVYDYNGGLGADKCYPGISFFTYVTTDASGDYVRHYVGDSGDCSAAGLSSAVCDDSDAARQNVANWFSYYHTRILLAKSGLMQAFSGVNPKYRIGFGSINNTAATYIRTLDHAYQSGNDIANVKPFGDGSAGSQKADFWHWVIAVTPSGSTPLRNALKSVGQYYQEDQPWASTNPVTGDTDYLACRQSYTILTTDGFWNGDSPGVGDKDDNAGNQITGPKDAPYTYVPTAPFKDGPSSSDFQSNTLADVAMDYWMTDLKPDISNEVPTSGIHSADPAFWQHMVTFTMGMGFTPSDAAGNPITSTVVQELFEWAKTGTEPAALDWGGWPVPSREDESGKNNGSINNVADLVHAGVDGHGGFFSATDAKSFVDGLTDALAAAGGSSGSSASAAANSTELNEGSVLYQARYVPTGWSGDLSAFSIDQTTGNIIPPIDPVTGEPPIDPTTGEPYTSWNASAVMPAAADRNIHTYVPAGGSWTAGSGADVAFKNDRTTPPALSTAELDALGSDTASQVNMVNYLRGDDSLDQANGGPYRDRSTVLGDIVDSQPVYVAPPDPNAFSGSSFKGSASYAAFVGDNASRPGLLYVAANDGMLHAFNAETGKEIYAFLPADVITHGGVNGAGQTIGISELADPAYGKQVAPHQYFNDGQLTVAAAYFDDAWHTVLVGTTGRGMARTVYALDVTDPGPTGAGIKLLWERSAWDGGANSGYIGQMPTKPIIAQVGNGDWAVLIGNGYNSANGVAALLQFKLSDGTLSVHKTSDTTTGNGLAAPAVWIGDPGNGVSTMAYAGDLHGHVWSFQLSKVTVAGGVTTVTPTSDSTGSLLFTAMNDDNQIQPITAGMLVGTDPDTGNRWLFFGTGRYLSSDDISNTNVQSWYGLIVDAPGDATLVSNLANGRSALAKRAIIAQTAGDPEAGVSPARVVSPPDDANTPSISGKSGWYIDLQTPTTNAGGSVTGYASEGERMVVPNQFHAGRLIGTSIIPKSTDLCNPTGTGFVMAVEPFTGTNPRPQFFDINGDGVINSEDMIQVGGKSYAAAGVGFGAQPNSPIFLQGNMYTSLANTKLGHNKVNDSSNTLTRVSWREMVNP